MIGYVLSVLQIDPQAQRQQSNESQLDNVHNRTRCFDALGDWWVCEPVLFERNKLSAVARVLG